jgi:hypothetical protein
MGGMPSLSVTGGFVFMWARNNLWSWFTDHGEMCPGWRLYVLRYIAPTTTSRIIYTHISSPSTIYLCVYNISVYIYLFI